MPSIVVGAAVLKPFGPAAAMHSEREQANIAQANECLNTSPGFWISNEESTLTSELRIPRVWIAARYYRAIG
jgi:hypothetical protein